MCSRHAGGNAKYRADADCITTCAAYQAVAHIVEKQLDGLFVGLLSLLFARSASPPPLSCFIRVGDHFIFYFPIYL